jgi:ABC-type multidrug transport system ATPase subunit/ABC-type multidrug transport system permease subunit
MQQRPTAPATVLHSGRRIVLPGGELSIGRLPDNDVVIDKEAVSRHHAQILAAEGGYQIVDLGSKNGTQLNGERFRGDSRWLSNGDTIVIGGEPLRFLTGQETRLLSGRQPLIGTQLVRFEGDRLAIGRDRSNDVVLEHPAVSRLHAEVVRADGRIRLRDLGSRNGTRVDGALIARTVDLDAGSEIGIGPYRLLFDGDAFVARDEQGALRLDAEAVGMEVKGKEILAPTSLGIAPGEFVAIIGESGAGKTTLLKALAGVTVPTRGAVLVNGEAVRGRLSDLGYLPQDEIVHPNLTVRESLRYSARLRLPSDAPADETDATVQRVASELQLDAHLDTRIASLSGGQRKRVGVATELLSRPSLVFLDEPTTGLDPGLESKMMSLLRDLAAPGTRAVVLVTHATKNLGLCDRLVVMGRGGILCFEGTPDAALRFFDVETYDGIYEALADGRPEDWQRKLLAQAATPAHAPEPRTTPAAGPRASKRRARITPQAAVLTARYALLMARDRRNLLILLGQVPVLALVIVGLFGGGLFDRAHGSARDATTVLFLIVTTALWLGSIAAAREIVKEKSVFVRERAVGVRIGAYVLSKAVVLFAIAALQTVALTAIIVAFRPLDEPARVYGAVFAILIVTSFAAVGIGLLVSSLVRTQDQATSFIPLVLIPQLFLGGTLVTVAKMSPVMAAVSKVVVAQWAFAGLGSAVHANARIAADRQFARVSQFGTSFFDLSQTTTFLVLGGFVVAAFAAVGALLARATQRV